MGISFHVVKSLSEGCVPRGVCVKEHVTDEGVILIVSNEVTSASYSFFEHPSIHV